MIFHPAQPALLSLTKSQPNLATPTTYSQRIQTIQHKFPTLEIQKAPVKLCESKIYSSTTAALESLEI